jgi:hypothetical protein
MKRSAEAVGPTEIRGKLVKLVKVCIETVRTGTMRGRKAAANQIIVHNSIASPREFFGE